MAREYMVMNKSEMEDTDVVRVNSRFMKSIISKILKKVVKDKLGKNVCVALNDLNIEIGENANLHLDVSVQMPKEELKSLIFEKMGL